MILHAQASVLRAWGGKSENVKAGQEELRKRAKVFNRCLIRTNHFTLGRSLRRD